jgi:hypothetical protein
VGGEPWWWGGEPPPPPPSPLLRGHPGLNGGRPSRPPPFEARAPLSGLRPAGEDELSRCSPPLEALEAGAPQFRLSFRSGARPGRSLPPFDVAVFHPTTTAAPRGGIAYAAIWQAEGRGARPAVPTTRSARGSTTLPLPCAWTRCQPGRNDDADAVGGDRCASAAQGEHEESGKGGAHHPSNEWRPGSSTVASRTRGWPRARPCGSSVISAEAVARRNEKGRLGRPFS